MHRIRPQTGPIQRLALRSLLLLPQPQQLDGTKKACQRNTSLSKRSFRKQETVLRYGNFVKSRIFRSDHVLRSREWLLNRIVPKDLVSSSDLVVTFVHKDLRLKNGIQIYPVNQVKMAFKGVRICKKEGTPLLATKQYKLRQYQGSTLSYSEYPTWCSLLSWARKAVVQGRPNIIWSLRRKIYAEPLIGKY